MSSQIESILIESGAVQLGAVCVRRSELGVFFRARGVPRLGVSAYGSREPDSV